MGLDRRDGNRVAWRALRPWFAPVLYPRWQARRLEIPFSCLRPRTRLVAFRHHGDARRGVAVIEGVGQGDLGNILGVFILEDLGIDEEDDRHLGGGTRIQSLLLEAETLDFGEVAAAKLRRHVEDRSARDRC